MLCSDRYHYTCSSMQCPRSLRFMVPWIGNFQVFVRYGFVAAVPCRCTVFAAGPEHSAVLNSENNCRRTSEPKVQHYKIGKQGFSLRYQVCLCFRRSFRRTLLLLSVAISPSAILCCRDKTRETSNVR